MTIQYIFGSDYVGNRVMRHKFSSTEKNTGFILRPMPGKRTLSFFLFSIFLIGCSGKTDTFGPRVLKADSASSGVVVFVPGYKGSELISSSGKRLWLGPSQALAFSTPDLSLKDGDGIMAGDILSSVTAIPGILDVKVYSPWLKRLESEAGLTSYVFPYDWRKDNGSTSLLLETFLERIKKESGGKAPVVVGHSNGGTLTLSVLNRRPDLISKAVFVGAPFHSGIGFLEDLMLPQATGLNGKIADPCVVSTFASVYTFFPREASFDTRDVLSDTNGKFMENRFFRAAFWKEHELGPFSKTASCSNLPEEKEFQKRLDRAKAFRDSLTTKTEKIRPSVLVVRAVNRPTLRVLYGEKTTEGWKWDFAKAKRTNGDGRVTAESALPPPGIEYELFESEAEHSKLLSDTKVQDRILEFSRSR